MRSGAAAAAVLVAACAASPNPARDELRPVPTGARPPASSAAPAPGDAPEQAAAAPKPAERVDLAVAHVGGKPIDVREFLARLWFRDQVQARQVLENLVFAQVTLFEADRLGLSLEPAQVDSVVKKARAALEAKLAEKEPRLSVEEFLRTERGWEPAAYEAQVRRDAIIQLLAERCVRGWALESGRARVRLMELADDKDLEAVQAGLAAGGDFEELARRHSVDARAEEGGTGLVLVRTETHPLARLAMATPVGEVGGPLEERGHFLLLRVESKDEPYTGELGAIAPLIESSLASSPVDDDEYVQWRAAMFRRYQVDLEPMLELTGGRP
jgi:parvulin-like peptidyl-prolyl isomerase